ncbi:MAG: hypothetical protein A2133_12260 [Actinobacteria bacterium RBG_16_64_13]|nr:MAG: hypothetical protein A2133_12260 [Actinobacteria bacterium RBG_16_64_13]
MKISRGFGLLALLVAVLLLSTGLAAASVSFPDVPAGHMYYQAITGMADRHVIGGYANGDFGPSDLVTRQQFAKMIVLTMGLTVAEDDFPDSAVPFVDLGPDDLSSLYPHEYVAVCALNSITAGKTATTFAPSSNITRQQVISMIVRAADKLAPGVLGQVPGTGWTGELSYSDPNHGANIQKAEYNGLLSGLTGAGGDLEGWDPTQKATRGEVAQMLWNLIGSMDSQAKWVDLSPAVSPLPRQGHAMVSLPGSSRIMLFGGVAEKDGNTEWEDTTYEYDLALNTWTSVAVAGDKPSSRWGHSMVYCASTGKVILFGGHNFSGDLNDIWTYAPSTHSWIQSHPAGEVPSGRAGHMMVYVPSTGKVILYGGMYLPSGAQAYVGRSDTWSYDPAANTWTELHPALSPGARKGGCLAYDPVGAKVILFGGVNPGWPTLNDTWEYEPVARSWTKLTPSGTLPAARHDASCAFDPVGRSLVVFAGLGEHGELFNETWTYGPSANSWTKLAPLSTPPARYAAAMVYEPAGGRLILFGGIPKLNEGKLGDTWSFSP